MNITTLLRTVRATMQVLVAAGIVLVLEFGSLVAQEKPVDAKLIDARFEALGHRVDQLAKAIDDFLWYNKFGDVANIDKVFITGAPLAKAKNPVVGQQVGLNLDSFTSAHRSSGSHLLRTTDQEESADKSFKVDNVNVSIGTHRFSGKTTETLDNGWLLSVQLQLRPFAGVTGLRLGICPFEMGGNDFKLTPHEKDTIKIYSFVTQSGSTRTVEPPTEITASFYRASIVAQLHPVELLSAMHNSASFSPFIGAGLCFYRVWLKDAGEGLNDDSHSSFGLFANGGIELSMGKDAIMKIELLYAPTPDWRVRLLPELRPIEKGNYFQLKFGLGFKPVG